MPNVIIDQAVESNKSPRPTNEVGNTMAWNGGAKARAFLAIGSLVCRLSSETSLSRNAAGIQRSRLSLK